MEFQEEDKIIGKRLESGKSADLMDTNYKEENTPR